MNLFSLQAGAVRQYVIDRKVSVSNALMESGVRLLKAGCMGCLSAVSRFRPPGPEWIQVDIVLIYRLRRRGSPAVRDRD